MLKLKSMVILMKISHFVQNAVAEKNTIIKRDTYSDDKSFLLIFNRYGDGKTYRCNEC